MARYDVVILGGGIIGCTLAEELARRGQKVAVIDKGRCCQEASRVAAGMLIAAVEFPKPTPLFDLAVASRQHYPRWLETMQRRSGRNVEYSNDGLVMLPRNLREDQALAKQQRWQEKRGVRIERWSRKQLRAKLPSVDKRFTKGYFFGPTAQVDTQQLTESLVEACRRSGVVLLEHTEAQRLIIKQNAVRGVKTQQEEIQAGVVVNCLGPWANMDGRFPIEIPVHPVRGQILTLQAPKRTFRQIVMTRGIYLVQRRSGRLVVGATAEKAGFEKGVTLAGIEQLTSGARQVCPKLVECPVVETAVGFRPGTPDELPIIGRTPIEGLFVATGHYRHGILLAPITAQIMAGLILGGQPEIDITPFDPARFAKKS